MKVASAIALSSRSTSQLTNLYKSLSLFLTGRAIGILLFFEFWKTQLIAFRA
ncbi:MULTISPECIES: hypothetical protein [unclassified Microcoleus]|uniref:hypothetical protein n=1 Tax=unclassified Microcoleus TaxID=2642155 RepID=UPI002FCEA2CC